MLYDKIKMQYFWNKSSHESTLYTKEDGTLDLQISHKDDNNQQNQTAESKTRDMFPK